MDFLELAAKRYSTRNYKSDAISHEDLDKILEAARLAPTAHNLQPQQIIVAKSEQALEKVAKCTVCHYGAPVALIVSYDKNQVWTREYDGKCAGDVDASIVTTHMMLAAESLGIGSTWIMYFDPKTVTEEFNLPENIVPSAILYLGYSNAEASPNHTARKDLAEYVSYQ